MKNAIKTTLDRLQTAGGGLFFNLPYLCGGFYLRTEPGLHMTLEMPDQGNGPHPRQHLVFASERGAIEFLYALWGGFSYDKECTEIDAIFADALANTLTPEGQAWKEQAEEFEAEIARLDEEAERLQEEKGQAEKAFQEAHGYLSASQQRELRGEYEPSTI